MTYSTQSPVLVLNASYEPISICLARRAIRLLVKGAAMVEEHRDVFIHRDVQLPSVIRLKRYRSVPVRRMVVTRRSLLLRDRYICQYCGIRFAAGGLTLDHVMPRARGGPHTWENLVAACVKCNHRKGNRTPEEAGMPLLVKPRALTVHTHRSLMRSEGAHDEVWKKYLFY